MPLLVLAGACAEKPVESPLPPLVVTQAVDKLPQKKQFLVWLTVLLQAEVNSAKLVN